MITDFKKKQKSILKKEEFYLLLAGILFLIISVVLIYSDIKIYKKKQELFAIEKKMQKQVADLETKNLSLKKGIENSGNNEYIEKIAREELGLQKDGEKVVSFIIPKKQEEKTSQQSKSRNWLSGFLDTWNWLIK